MQFSGPISWQWLGHWGSYFSNMVHFLGFPKSLIMTMFSQMWKFPLRRWGRCWPALLSCEVSTAQKYFCFPQLPTGKISSLFFPLLPLSPLAISRNLNKPELLRSLDRLYLDALLWTWQKKNLNFTSNIIKPLLRVLMNKGNATEIETPPTPA